MLGIVRFILLNALHVPYYYSSFSLSGRFVAAAAVVKSRFDIYLRIMVKLGPFSTFVRMHLDMFMTSWRAIDYYVLSLVWCFK